MLHISICVAVCLHMQKRSFSVGFVSFSETATDKLEREVAYCRKPLT